MCCQYCQKLTTAHYLSSYCRYKLKIKMEKNLKITTKKQMEKLVEVMKLNPDIGRGKLPFGFSKMQLKDKWEEFSMQLNGLGPPIRSTKEWQRVWTHHKANLKRKLASNKQNFQATGGGPSTEISLSPLEQSTAELVSMQSNVNPNGSAMGLERQEDSDAAESTVRPEEHSRIAACSKQPERRRRSKSKLEDDRLEILKTQSQNQEEIMRILKQMEKNSYKNYEVNKKMYELKKKKADLQMKLIKAKLELTNKRIQEM